VFGARAGDGDDRQRNPDFDSVDKMLESLESTSIDEEGPLKDCYVEWDGDIVVLMLVEGDL